ncbi:Retrovirus-related Pol polyprotein from transposon opus [Araneus ventricosus]|uniref:Retrovirus-related Pol polyprotein from transposon opus n=1 Tax=Araneus ventricosus TaxID=182803 RepID=A0A4Y2WEL6_ARAVE|nr:Retrovirus-related Pol polyprotein from transposon opus [Araneus ventricosus]GBO35915.1 Retrovirus-related Pol polyprotein from transposon opus [Araneus ventricosus]
MLAYPKHNTPLSLVTNASETAIGAVLQQHVEGGTEPLGFFSRKLNAAERKYSTYDRELLAIYSAIRFFRYFVEGRDFLVFTDHKPLTYAFKQNHEKNSPRQIRHLEFIGQFTTDLRYISGSANLVADTFSRIAAISVPESIDFDEMAVAQDSDVE